MKRAAVIACLLVATLALVGVGRWEATRDIDAQRAGMARAFAAAGAHPIPTGWRIDPFRCLFYRSGAVPMAYELCFDGRGYLVETIDRRSGSLVVSTLRWQPSKATLRVSSTALDGVLRQMDAFAPQASRGPGMRFYGAAFHRLVQIPAGSGLPSPRR